MLTAWTEILTANNGLLLIIITSLLVVLVIIFRIIFLKRIPMDKVNKIQKSELRQKWVITRDQYELQTWKQMFDNSQVIVIGIHGLQGQKDDFKMLASYCKKQQWSLIAYDRRGEGKNLTDWKFNSFKTDVNDAIDVISAVKDKYPNHKIIIFGESLGATIACHAAYKNQEINAVVVSNLITRYHLHRWSIGVFLRFFFGFILTSKIKIPFFIDPTIISKNNAYITNVNQRYSLKQVWTVRYLFQLKQFNKTAIKEILELKQPILILQSGDDVFSDFHQLKKLQKKWKTNQKYYFHWSGKHALINEVEMSEIFPKQVVPWIKTVTLKDIKNDAE